MPFAKLTDYLKTRLVIPRSEATEESKIYWHRKRVKEYYVYIMTNGVRTLYIGVTNDLMRRVFEHKEKLTEGFTKSTTLPCLYIMRPPAIFRSL